MESFWFNVRYVVRHPRFALEYATRETILTRLLGTKRETVHEAMQESKPILDRIFNALKDQPWYGYMDKRKYEVIYALVRIAKPRIVLETGVAAGVSSYCILLALENNGQQATLTSIDIGNTKFDGIVLPADRPIGWLVPASLRKNWKLVIGSSSDTLPETLRRSERVDLFLHDSEHSYENMLFEYSKVWPFLNTGGVIISDNIEWNDAFREFCHSVVSKRAELFGLGVAVKQQ
jgi:predicted O-methyltransferase YrrM